MAQATWNILDSVTTGGILWLSLVLIIAFVGEVGLPFTAPVLESLLIYTGFHLAGGAMLTATAPFLTAVFMGRLAGTLCGYQLSKRLGRPFIGRFGQRLGITMHRVAMLRQRISELLVPSVILARFTPGLCVLTTIACGVSSVRTTHFLGAVAAQLLIWEAVFLGAGAVARLASQPLDPDSYPKVLLVTVCVAIALGAVARYVAFRRLHRPVDSQATTTSRL